MDGSAKVSLILELKERIKAGLNSAKQYVNSSVSEIKDRLSSVKEHHIQTFKAMESEIPGFGRAMDFVTNKYVALAAAVVALATAYITSVNKAVDWEKGMAKINVTAQLTRGELSKLSGELINIGERNVTPLAQVPDAFNRIISAGLDVGTSLATIEPVLKGAKAGFTDLETTAAATVSTMNSSGISDATRVLDILFATVNKGNAEFQDVSQYLPKIVPNARAAGLSLEETAGAWAYLTAQGRSAEQSTTGLLNLFRQLSTPDVVNNMKQMGVSVYDTTGKIRPLISIITDLKGRIDGLSDRKRGAILNGLGLDVESIGALNNMTQDVGKLKDIIDFTTNSQGQLQLATENARTSMDSWGIIINKVQGFFIGIGQTALPIIDGIGKAILNSGTAFNVALPYIEALAAGVGAAALAYAILNPNIILSAVVSTAAAVANGVLTAAMWALNIAMNANPVGLIITGIGLLVAGFVLAYKKSQTFRAGLMGLWEVIKLLGDVVIGFGKTLIGTFTFNPALIRDGLVQSASAFTKIIHGGISDAFNKGYENSIAQDKLDELKKQKEQTKENPFETKPGAPAGKPPGKPKSNPEGDSVGKIVGGSQQVRNITVNIDSFVKGGINTNNTQGLNGLSAEDIQKYLENMAIRLIRGLETSYD